jgi:hypothetical protein
LGVPVRMIASTSTKQKAATNQAATSQAATSQAATSQAATSQPASFDWECKFPGTSCLGTFASVSELERHQIAAHGQKLEINEPLEPIATGRASSVIWFETF